ESADIRPGVLELPPRAESRGLAQPGIQTENAPPLVAGLIEVHRGDSLWQLARVYLGDGRLWKRLWNANPDLRDPNLIRTGALLRLPDSGTPPPDYAGAGVTSVQRSGRAPHASDFALTARGSTPQTVRSRVPVGAGPMP